jgi:hypothetical protein
MDETRTLWIPAAMQHSPSCEDAGAGIWSCVQSCPVLRMFKASPQEIPAPLYVVFSNVPGGPDEEAIFVEVETVDGTGVTLAKRADWHPHPHAPHLARLGPFYTLTEHT